MEHLNISVLDQFAEVSAAAADAALSDAISANNDKIIVLDDDPTGVQTVHDVSVYTDWSKEYILRGFAEENKLFYILTNSRGMTATETEKVHRQIASWICEAARETGRGYIIISRSDSTLRGHYPLETQVIRDTLASYGKRTDGEIICPFFAEGGRYTINSVHYVRQGDELIPAAETEFAKDKTFGYSHSYLPEYIEEKTGGACRAQDVIRITMDMLRSGNIGMITEKLMAAHDFARICADAVSYEDVKILSSAVYAALAAGKSFLFRSAAGLVKALGNISDRPLLRASDMLTPGSGRGGLVVVGSHTAKTTKQLENLLKLDGTVPISFDSDKVLLGDAAFNEEIDRCAALETEVIKNGGTAVCFTKRTLLSLPDDTKETALMRSVKISDGVQRLVGQIQARPAFVIAKGGITSSDIGTKALRVKRADVMGQILPGIPVWRLGPESMFEGMPYVIFPGNTGDEYALYEAVKILTGR